MAIDSDRSPDPAADGPRTDEVLLIGSEAARVLRVCPRTLCNLVSTGQVPFIRIGRRVLFPADQLRAWVIARERQEAEFKLRLARERAEARR